MNNSPSGMSGNRQCSHVASLLCSQVQVLNTAILICKITVFIEICSREHDETVYIALIKKSIEQRELLQLYNSFTFSGLQKCSWRRVKRGRETNSLPPRVGGEIYWYVAGNQCLITKDDTEQVSLSGCEKFGLRNVSGFQGCINFADISEPSSAYLRGLYSSQEMNIEGTVHIFNPRGWIEIVPTSIKSQLFTSRFVNVFIVHYRLLDVIDKLQKGAAVRISFVFPIYLWGRLHGFAATVRSHIEILQHKLPTNVKNRSNQSNGFTNRLNIPFDIKDRCHMYAAWRAYIYKKFIAATCHYRVICPLVLGACSHNSYSSNICNGSSSSSRSSSTDSSCCDSSGSSKLQESHVTLFASSIRAEVLFAIEGWTPIGTESCNDSSASTSGTVNSSNNDSSSNTSIDRENCNSNFHNSASSSLLAQLCTLPANRSVQEQFISRSYTELFAVR